MTDAERLRDDVARAFWDDSPPLARAMHGCPAEIDEGLLGSALVLHCATDNVRERLQRVESQITKRLVEMGREGQPTEIRLQLG